MTGVAVRALHGHRELRALADCFATIWGSTDEQITPTAVLVGAELSGHQVLGAFDGDELVGGSWGFLVWDGAALSLHSHITGVLPAYRGAPHHLGFVLKAEQRTWCLARGIERVTWTFDPMIARNAAFNLRKLGAIAVAFHADFYGPMPDRYNAGEPTDRLEVVWDLRRSGPPPAPAVVRSVPVPADYGALRKSDAAAAAAERARVRTELTDAFAAGLVATGFDPEHGYLLSPPGR